MNTKNIWHKRPLTQDDKKWYIINKKQYKPQKHKIRKPKTKFYKKRQNFIPKYDSMTTIKKINKNIIEFKTIKKVNKNNPTPVI